MTLEELQEKLKEEKYICDDQTATVLTVALKLGRPLLIEGAAGVGKTEVAKVLAHALGRDLVRLQCYEGLDESKALYEWNYQKQLLAIQVGKRLEEMAVDEKMLMAGEDALMEEKAGGRPEAAGMAETSAGGSAGTAGRSGAGGRQGRRAALSTSDLFSEEYLLERPLLKSIRSEKPVVLLIDEVDKADEEFEAFLLELLSEMQVTIPEMGTIRAKSIPFIVLTSNQARPLSEALRRRCAYLYIPYPDLEKELAILHAKLPNIDAQLELQVALAVKKLRESDEILKKPSIAETLDWASALDALGVRALTPDAIRQTEGFVLKNEDDFEAAERILGEEQ